MKKKLSLNKKTIASLTNTDKIMGGGPNTEYMSCIVSCWSEGRTGCISENPVACEKITRDGAAECVKTHKNDGCPGPSLLDPNCTEGSVKC